MPQSEYRTLLAAIDPHLRDRSLAELSRADAAALAETAGVTPERVVNLVRSAKLAAESGLPPELLYGVIRGRPAGNLTELLSRHPRDLRTAYENSVYEGAVDALANDSTHAVDRLVAMSIDRTPVATLAGPALERSPRLRGMLEEQGIATVADLRRRGGLESEDLGDSDRALARRLDAHARLLSLVPDVAFSDRLIDAGYATLNDVSRASAQEIAAATGTPVDAPLIKEVTARAKAQAGMIQSISYGVAGIQATGLGATGLPGGGDQIHQVVGQTCSCRDCEAAVGPLAYLGDLIVYAVDHLRNNGQAIDLPFLESTFHQPFGRLPAACSAVEEKVRQVRLCIEVLRSHLGTRPLADAARESALQQAERQYLLTAYQLLLNQVGASFADIRLARAGTSDERRRIAEAIGVFETALPGLFIDPAAAPAQIEQALESTFGLRDTRQPPLRSLPASILRNARIYLLRQSWRGQDWPADDYSARRSPVVDPDVLGPDDFRWPYRKTNPAAPDRAFDLWVARRTWLDSFLATLEAVPPRQAGGVTGPDFAAIVAAFGGTAYRGRNPIWPASAVADVRTALRQMDAANAEATRAMLLTNFGLTPDAAAHLVELADKDAAYWRSPTRAARLETAEWRELRSILARAKKNALRPFWIVEEAEAAQLRAQAGELRAVWSDPQDAGQILLGQRELWRAIRSPPQGEWPPSRVTGRPLIDPERLHREDLPEPTAGRSAPGNVDARTMWNARDAELVAERSRLEDLLGSSGFEPMMTEALGPVPAGATWTAYLRNQNAALVGRDAAAAAAARTAVEQTLGLTLEQFQRLLTVMEQQAGPAGQPLPSASDWADVLGALATSWKVRTRYPAWYAAETDPATGLEPWRCARHALPAWRATLDDRSAWQRALEARSRRPIVDPDLLASTGYLRTPGAGNAWTTWNARRTAVAAKFRTLFASTRTLASFEQMVDGEIGNGALDEMVAGRAASSAMAPRLAQWNLSFEGLNELLRTRALLAATPPQSVLDSEWTAAASLLTQVWKERQAADWRIEEQALDLALDPATFRLLEIDPAVFPPLAPPELDRWRAPATALLDWQDRLQSRLDATTEVDRALARAVSDVEAATLPALRDALIVAAVPVGRGFAAAQRWLGDRLAIATEYGGCHETTRITQAIETLQGILWGTRTGTLADHYPGFSIESADFDEEWQWIGSYATWRAAMFVFLYPENILLPSLRGRQTPGFRRFVDELRGGRQVTPAVARQVAARYFDYFRDVCTLEVRATQRAMVATPDGDQSLFFIFARAGDSGRLYWTTLAQWSSEFALSYWDVLPGLGKVRSVPGTAVYELAGGRRYVCLFVIVSKDGADELSLLRFEASAPVGHRWSDPIALASPPGGTSYEAALIDRSASGDPLGVRFRLANGVIYERYLNAAGDDWTSADWIAQDRYWPLMVRSGTGTNQLGGGVLSVTSEGDDNVLRLFAVAGDGTVRTTKWNDYFADPATKLRPLSTITAPFPAGAAPVFGAGTEVRVLRCWNQLTAVFLTDAQGQPWELVLSAPESPWKVAGGSPKHGSWSTTITTGARVPPAAISLTPNHSQVMIFLSRDSTQYGGNSVDYNPDNTQQCLWLARSGWGSWFDTHNERRDKEPYWPVDSPVAAVSRTKDVIDLFIAGEDDILYTAHTEDKGGSWSPWKALPGSPRITSRTPIAVISSTPSTLEVFTVDSTGICRTVDYSSAREDNDGWSSWSEVGGNIRFAPQAAVTATVVGEGHVVLFAVTLEGRVRSTWKMGSGAFARWQPWSEVPSPPGVNLRRVAAAARPVWGLSDQIVLFALADDGEILWSASEVYLPVLSTYLENLVWKPNVSSLASSAPDERLSAAERQQRKTAIPAMYGINWFASRSVLSYLEEAFYFVPVHLALQLQAGGHYIAALDWFRLVYEYAAPEPTRALIGLAPEPANATDAFIRSTANWLLDPLNPHAIAATRRGAYSRFTLMSIIRCLLGYADSEFTQDTAESVPRARELYETALELLASADLRQGTTACQEVIGELSIELSDPAWRWVASSIRTQLASVNDPAALKATVGRLNAAFEGDGTAITKLEAAQPILAEISTAATRQPLFSERLREAKQKTARLESAALAQPEVAAALGTVLTVKDTRVTTGGATGPLGGFGTAALSFCVPANPLLRVLRLSAEVNLYKLRNCRNIAGLLRQIEPFAAPTDTVSGLPAIGSSGQLVTPAAATIGPTAYRYSVLIERARRLVEQAMQLEAAFLAALEKSDKEAYDLLTARSNAQLAQAGVRLQDLRIVQSQDGVQAAQLQRARARIQVDTYTQWINQGLTPSELSLLGLYDTLALFQIIATNLGALMQGITGGMQIAMGGPFTVGVQFAFQSANLLRGISESLAINAQRDISRLNVMIALEQHTREWALQKTVAEQDGRIAEQQITLANDQVRISQQERAIEGMRAEQARDALDFISNKFTNKELYDWMSGVLARVYGELLREATSTARLAAAQLAFERQEPPPAEIQNDYWEAPDTTDASASPGPDRRGLTGSARLLQDISRLDQYAFEKNRRKQQLTKTISLAQLDPLAFQRFIDTGVLPFATPMELFDRDFPGHYLRLIRRVRTSLIALIPPTSGIRATLTASGISRAVIGGELFQTAILRHPPEVVSLTAPMNATGVFDLQEQPELLAPFEGHGVATTWEFRLPKAANPFEFSTILDVLVTIEYTAFDSFDYRTTMVQSLNARRTLSAERAFSFRQDFADAWYDLHNPDQTPTPLSVRVRTVRQDFAPNLDNLRIEHVTLYFSRAAGSSIELDAVDLRLLQSTGSVIGGICRTNQAVVSTRSGNGAPWLGMRDLSPFADWELTLPDNAQMRGWLKSGEIRDIVLIVTYGGRLPEWPP